MRAYLTFCSSMLLLLLGLAGCNFEGINCQEGNGNTEAENRPLPVFSSISNATGADIRITQGPSQSVTVNAQPNLFNEIKTYVVNGELRIETDRCIKNISDIKIDITMEKITSLKNNGAGHIIGITPWVSDDLTLTVGRSGNIYGDLLTPVLSSKINGSGSLILKGQAQRHNATISASGNIDAFDLLTEDSQLSIGGSGSYNVYASKSLKVSISGSGNVYYKGTPVLDVSITGTGKVKSAN